MAERVLTFMQSIPEHAKETTRVTIIKFTIFFLAHSTLEIPTGTALFPSLPLFSVATTATKHTSLLANA